jgi:hypothetical protein
MTVGVVFIRRVVHLRRDLDTSVYSKHRVRVPRSARSLKQRNVMKSGYRVGIVRVSTGINGHIQLVTAVTILIPHIGHRNKWTSISDAIRDSYR